MVGPANNNAQAPEMTRPQAAHGLLCRCPHCLPGVFASSETGKPVQTPPAQTVYEPNSAVVAGTAETGVAAILRRGASWSSVLGQGATVTFSFPDLAPSGQYVFNEAAQFLPFSQEQRQAARRALQTWSAVANIQFIETAGNAGRNGQIRFSNTTVGETVAHAYYPDSNGAAAGDIWVDPTVNSNLRLEDGDYGYLTLIHEVGHAIGLDHPGRYNGSRRGQAPGYADDNLQYTVMSYFEHPGDPRNYAHAPLLHDIAAAQTLYGVDTTSGTGNTVYRWENRAQLGTTIWDVGGIDTIDVSNQFFAATLDLRQGGFSSIGANSSGAGPVDNVSIAFGVEIENAIGTQKADTIVANNADNVLEGGLGRDKYLFVGAWGADRIQDQDRSAVIEITELSRGELTFVQQSSDLFIGKTAGSDQITVTDFFVAGAQFAVEVGGESLSAAEILAATPGMDDPDNRFGALRSVATGTTIEGTLAAPQDRDWFSVQLQGNITYQYDLSAVVQSGLDPKLSLRNADGEEILFNDNGLDGQGARIRFRPQSSGTYFLVAGGDAAGAYQLRAAATTRIVPAAADGPPNGTGDDVADGRYTDQSLALGDTIERRLSHAQDKDWFRVSLRPGVTYQFEALAQSSGQGTLQDPHLTLHNAAGELLRRNDNGGAGQNARLRVRPTLADTFYIAVGGSGAGSYTLKMVGTTRVLPDITDDVAATTSLSGGVSAADAARLPLFTPVAGELVQPWQQNWFEVDLQADVTYQFKMLGQSSGEGTLADPMLSLRNSNGIELLHNDNGGLGSNATLRYRPTENDLFYVVASGRGTGNYRLESAATTRNVAAAPEPPLGVAAMTELPLQAIRTPSSLA